MEIETAPDTEPSDDGTELTFATAVRQPNTELECEVCGVALSYGGRGRKPRFCAEHKPTKGSSSRSSGKSIDTLVEQIGDIYRASGAGLSMFPTTVADGQMLAYEATKLAESWRPLIERDPKIRKMWERITTGGGWGSMIAVHAPIIMAIMMNHNIYLPGTKPKGL